jgi:hypothetical protein
LTEAGDNGGVLKEEQKPEKPSHQPEKKRSALVRIRFHLHQPLSGIKFVQTDSEDPTTTEQGGEKFMYSEFYPRAVQNWIPSCDKEILIKKLKILLHDPSYFAVCSGELEEDLLVLGEANQDGGE